MPSESVKVIVRVRPMNQREKDKVCTNVVEADVKAMQITLTNPADKDTQKVFTYDSVFPINCTQQAVYEQTAFQLVESVIQGYNGTIFAYGQTGCGKTHTMMGVPGDENLKGIIPRAFAHIFGNIESTSSKNFLIRCSYIEIYNEEIHDLIGANVKEKLDLKESNEQGLFIKGLAMHVVKTIPEIERLMNLGSKNRSVGETAMNKDSSRSHSIFTIYIECSELDEKGNQRITAGKLNLVDLAGSERQSKTQATGDRLKEANKINLSLSALGNVISALVDGKSSHVPYRDSKLTRLLQDSLGGNTKTVMVANVSPASDNYDETLGTLRYASRAKSIKNQPKVNEDPKDAMLREYADEIKRLKEMLQNMGGNNENINPADSKPAAKPKKTSDKDKIENELKQKEEQFYEEKKRREELEAKLKQMQTQIVSGHHVPGQKDDEGITDLQKNYQDMLQKIKEQEEKHEQILNEQREREEDVVQAEKKYANLQDEVEDTRKNIKRLRKRCKDAQAEIQDLEKEHERSREELFDAIRLLEKDVKTNYAIMTQVLGSEELEKLRKKAKWSEEKNEFVIPPFLVRQSKVKFPKVPFAQAYDMVKAEWKNREIEFLQHVEDDDDQNQRQIEEFWGDTTSNANKRLLEANKTLLNTKSIKSDLPSYQETSPQQKLKKGNGIKAYASNEQINDLPTFQMGTRVDRSQGNQIKKPTRGILLEPINQSANLQLGREKSNEDSGFIPKSNPTNLPTFNPKAGHLKPLNSTTSRGVKLQFKATVLINNDGNHITNAEFDEL